MKPVYKTYCNCNIIWCHAWYIETIWNRWSTLFATEPMNFLTSTIFSEEMRFVQHSYTSDVLYGDRFKAWLRHVVTVDFKHLKIPPQSSGWWFKLTNRNVQAGRAETTQSEIRIFPTLSRANLSATFCRCNVRYVFENKLRALWWTNGVTSFGFTT